MTKNVIIALIVAGSIIALLITVFIISKIIKFKNSRNGSEQKKLEEQAIMEQELKLAEKPGVTGNSQKHLTY